MGWLVFTGGCIVGMIVVGVVGGRRERELYDALPADERHLSYAEWSMLHGYDDGLIQ